MMADMPFSAPSADRLPVAKQCLRRIGAALGMTVEDVYWQHRRPWVRLHEEGGKETA